MDPLLFVHPKNILFLVKDLLYMIIYYSLVIHPNYVACNSYTEEKLLLNRNALKRIRTNKYCVAGTEN